MIDYFKDDEFLCRCLRPECDAPKKLDPFFRIKLNGIRLELGEPMVIDSGCRCIYWNHEKCGKADSQHLVANAVDVKSTGGDYMRRLVQISLKHGVTIGVMKGAVHLDNRPGLPLMFGYDA